MVNPMTLKQLGVELQVTQKMNTLDELRKQPPGMVIGVATKKFWFSINQGNVQEFKKGAGKILSLFIYQQLEKSKEKRKQLRPGKIKFKNIYKPYTGQDLTDKTLLVWRTGGIGDLCFIQPNMIWLKKRYPTCKIWFSCSPVYWPLVDNWDCYDELVPFPVDVERVRRSHYHATFEGVIERCVEAESTNSYELFSKWMGTDVPKEELIPIQKTKPENDEKVLRMLSRFGVKPYKFIAVQLRSSTPIRTPSSEDWGRWIIPLLRDGHFVIITDSARMKDRLDMFIKLIIPEPFRDQMLNFAPYSTSLDMSISLLNFAQLVIAPDTSMVHIAAGLRAPILGVYGAFPGDIRMSTYPNADWIEPPGNDTNICKYGGKNCYTHGQVCPAGKPGQCAPCYNRIDNELFYKKVNKLLEIRKNLEYKEEVEDGKERKEDETGRTSQNAEGNNESTPEGDGTMPGMR